MEKVYDAMLNVFEIILDTEKISPSVILARLPLIIEKVEELGKGTMTGIEKKLMVISVLKKFISRSSLSDDEREDLMVFIDQALPLIIDAVVYAYNSKFFIKIKNSLKRRCKGCFKC